MRLKCLLAGYLLLSACSAPSHRKLRESRCGTGGLGVTLDSCLCNPEWQIGFSVYSLESEVILSLLRHCGTGPDKRPVSLLPSCQMVAQAKHAKDLDASASKLQSHHAELQENATQFLKLQRIVVQHVSTFRIVVQHCMKERLEHLEGKLGDSADKHSEAASGCAVLNMATIL